MGINSRALYSDLLQDLGGKLPGWVVIKLETNEDVQPWPEITVEELAALSLAKSFYKKFVEAKSSQADQLALDKFSEINSLCEHFKLKFEEYADQELLDELKFTLWKFFSVDYLSCPSIGTVLDHANLGPGANLGARGNDFYTKLYASLLSTSKPLLYELFHRYVKSYPRDHSAENLRCSELGNFRQWEGNRLSFVPKTKDISRTICTEPTLNMYFQKGYGALLEKRLKSYFNIDLAYQPGFNRELCRRGSIDGSFTTIDLSSASDSMALLMLKEVLPREVLGFLMMFRSDYSILPNGSLVKLHMVSTMGNGYTFQLQTVLFACCVSAVYRLLGLTLDQNKEYSPGNWAVFGDDIIIRREADRLVRRLLTLLGFKVNADKSFNEGFFRESCGHDYFHGHNVRGVYVKNMKTPQDLFSILNQLNRWSARCNILLPRTVQHILSKVKRNLVPRFENDESGYKVPASMIKEYKLDKDTQSVKYRRWVAEPRYLFVKDDRIKSPRTVKKRLFNPEGLYLCALNGSLRAYRISIKLDRALFRLRTGITPNWDYHPARIDPTGPDLLDRDGWLRWETATLINSGELI
jgi:hypothetical protein